MPNEVETEKKKKKKLFKELNYEWFSVNQKAMGKIINLHNLK